MNEFKIEVSEEEAAALIDFHEKKAKQIRQEREHFLNESNRQKETCCPNTSYFDLLLYEQSSRISELKEVMRQQRIEYFSRALLEERENLKRLRMWINSRDMQRIAQIEIELDKIKEKYK